MSVNLVEVDSDEDDNEQGETNNQIHAGSESVEDCGESAENNTESGVDENKTETAEVLERRKVTITRRPNSLVEQTRKTPEPKKGEPECEYSYFCKSLLP